MADKSIWFDPCVKQEVKLDPKPGTEPAVWTIFKTKEEILVECDGFPCLNFKYGSVNNKPCTNYDQEVDSIEFVNAKTISTEVTTHYRRSGIFEFYTVE